MPILSIIVPVYNVSEYLDDCISSLIPQLNSDTEVLLIDDGSTDNSSRMCDHYASISEYIKVIHKRNGGLSSARNCGMENATGEYFFFLDSDDALPENSLKSIIVSIKANRPDVLYIGVEEVNSTLEDTIKPFENFDFEENTVFSAKELIGRFFDLKGMYLTSAPSKVTKKNFILKNELYFKNGIYHEDDEWTARLLVANPKVSFLNQKCYLYRHRENSIISSNDKDKIFKKNSDKIGFVDDILQTFKQTDVYSKAVQYYSVFYLSSIADCYRINPSLTKGIYKDTCDVINHLKYSENKKQRIIYYLFKAFGKNMTFKIIVNRY